MIKKYKEFINEGLLDHLEGPTENEVINNLKNNPLKLYLIGYEQDDEMIKSTAEKLITPEIKRKLVDDIIDTMIDITSNQLYDNNDIETLSYNDKIYDVSGEEWYKYFSFKENKLEQKLIDYHMKIPLEELFYYVFEFDMNI